MKGTMKSSLLIILLLLLSISFFSSPVYSTSSLLIWSVENQLTVDPVIVHPEWDEQHKRWNNWTEVLTDFDGTPGIAATSSNKLWLVWDSNPQETASNEIYYKSLSNTWSSETQLTNDLYGDYSPAVIQTSDGRIWVFWSSDRTGNIEIFYETTVNNGASWSAAIQATNDIRNDSSPAVFQTNDSKLWLVWSRRMNISNHEIFYKTFNGTAWSGETQLTINPNLDQMPSILQTSDGRIWVFWGQYLLPPIDEWEVFHKTSSNNGATWSSETQLTETNAEDDLDPTAFQEKDGTLWVFWASTRQSPSATFDIFYKSGNLTESGASWSPTVQFTTNNADDYWPAAVQRMDKSIWIVWTSTRPDPVYAVENVDLYVKATILGDIGGTWDPTVPDGYIDITDLSIIARALATDPSFPPGRGWNQWNPDCDLTVDNLVDIDDLHIAGKNFGRNAFG